MVNRNKVFQWCWYHFLKGNYPRKTKSDSVIVLEQYADRMIAQLDWADRFGIVDLVILGDSNAEELADYKSMKRFSKLTANIAISGTRADHWVEFFIQSAKGRGIYRRIKDKKILINIGGNHVLQNAMHLLPDALVTLSDKFPQAWWINLPSIYVGVLSAISGKPKDQMLDELKRTNLLIATVSNGKVIDIRSFTGHGEGNPYFYVLKDLVHYSDRFDQEIRIPLINFHIYRYGHYIK